MKIYKNFLAIITGCFVGALLIFVGERIMPILYPLPPGTKLTNIEDVKKVMAAMPVSAFLVLLANYALASFAGGLTATLITKGTRKSGALIVGLVLTAMGIANCMMLPHPLWFTMANFVVYVAFAQLGAMVVGRFFAAYRKKPLLYT